ncbi:unnamed protein product [Parascedosporium putredinis]|uniref:Uncharacterized protein n=1 Tax=Parascedosporium putredinis TaxID=1442378 RepID=A0A9P1H4V6_9PEZI|nr:unnamed protein product [Parascedosporium putredinis]CAI7997045.1 unnamed protein product [Parascedosporium putredinis]
MKFTLVPLLAGIGAIISSAPVAAQNSGFALGVHEEYSCSSGGCQREWSIGAVNLQNGATGKDKATGVGRSIYDICGSTIFGAQVWATRAPINRNWIDNFFPKSGESWGVNFICDQPYNPAEVRLYEHINYGGREVELTWQLEKCYNLPTWARNQISSARINSRLACRFYDNLDCKGSTQLDNRRSDISNFASLGWNDKIESAICIWV